MIAIVEPDAVDRVSEVLGANGESVTRLGEVVEVAGETRVIYHGHLDLTR
jgi:phosphoribosylformylglycinamidine cyclo-ligase